MFELIKSMMEIMLKQGNLRLGDELFSLNYETTINENKPELSCQSLSITTYYFRHQLFVMEQNSH